MSKSSSVFGIIAVTLGLVGCAHSTMRGTVAMKVSETEAHVCLGDGEVKAGDKVALFRNDCSGSVPKGELERSVCRKVRIGEGVVERTLNEHYSVVKIPGDVKYQEGTIVEKL